MAKKTKVAKKDYTKDAKTAISLFIVLLAFGVFLLFYVNKDSIMEAGNLGSVMTLIVIGMGFLIGLLYLVNASKSAKKRR